MSQSFAKQNMPFWFITLALLIVFLINPLTMQGVSGDGMVYSSVAYNMAHGIGSLWHPVYTKTWCPSFYEHPPLAMYLQSLLFRLLGDSFYVEKIYSGLMALLILFFIIQSWRLITDKKYSYWLAWLLIFIWLAIFMDVQAIKDNLIQNTMVVFTTASLYCLLCYSKRARTIYLLLASALMAAGFFTNGLQALFLLSYFLVFWLVFRSISWQKMCWLTGLLCLLVGLCIGAVLLDPAARYAMHMYFSQQVWASFNGVRPGPYIGWHHLYSLQMLFNALLPIILVTLLFFYIRKKITGVAFTKLLTQALWDKGCYFFVLLGLMGALPVMMSSRQQEHYLLQAIPLFILALAQLLTPECSQWVMSLRWRTPVTKVFTGCVSLLLLGSLIYTVSHVGMMRKDKLLIEDVQQIGTVVKSGSVVSLAPELVFEWSLYAYIYRYQQINLTADQNNQYLLMSRQNTNIPPSYQAVPLSLHLFALYQKTAMPSVVNQNNHSGTEIILK